MNTTLIYNFHRLFALNFDGVDSYCAIDTLDQNSFFSRYLVVDQVNESIDIPTMCFNTIRNTFDAQAHLDTLKDKKNRFLIPLYNNSYLERRATFSSIINTFFNKSELRQRLQKIITKSDQVYYGNRGIILDENFNLLLLCTKQCQIDVNSNFQPCKVLGAKIYVDPKVFIDQKNVINKGILKELIPYYTTNFTSMYGRNATVIVEDLQKFIMTANKPDLSTNIHESLNQCLVDNVNEIINEIKS